MRLIAGAFWLAEQGADPNSTFDGDAGGCHRSGIDRPQAYRAVVNESNAKIREPAVDLFRIVVPRRGFEYAAALPPKEKKPAAKEKKAAGAKRTTKS